ncbi:excinuclease ABC subunit UvrB [Candidatus Uhrbacteria bacterium]|nr:excinuclease ABC subunit UvrB [Candidatus Uhrbacteria bacterium]
MMSAFRLQSSFPPAGDQPQAIQKLSDSFSHFPRQTLLGITGSGKTYTVASVIENIQAPTLVLSHNKTLAAQLYTEFKSFFPNNKVCYFVSYYDYYQPESYLPQTDTYIEKETQINEKIDQLRLEAMSSLMTRPDTIVVASVSCIYALGNPVDFKSGMRTIKAWETMRRKDFQALLIELLYQRNDSDLAAGRFRVRGDVVDVIQGFGGDIYRFTFSGDEIESITTLDAISLSPTLVIPAEAGIQSLENGDSNLSECTLFPARPFITPEDKRRRALERIREELRARLKELPALEAHRLEQRTNYDLEMLEQIGVCKGVENYSRHFDDRKEGEPPFCLIDYFAQNPFSKDFLMVVDESHVTVPQVRGMYHGDRSRKKNLIDFGFRLPSAYDNRPLKFHEFEKYLTHAIFTSATPGEYESSSSGQIVEQVVRPTGLIDPPIIVKPILGCIEDVQKEIRATIEQGDRVLVTTLTKRSAEELAEYLTLHDIKARYLHSEIDTIERTKILKDLRIGVFDVLVGINLLREGLDIPEVALVAILDADKEGFLRNATSLIQTIGRGARNLHGRAILYADVMTESIRHAVSETERRRKIQKAYNKKHGITPRSIEKMVSSSFFEGIDVDAIQKRYLTPLSIHDTIVALQEEMRGAVERLDFEKAILLRDTLAKLKKEKRTRD